MKTTFPIIPSGAGPLWFFVIFAVFMLNLTVLIGWISLSSRTVRFEVSTAGLRIAGGMYGRLIPLTSIDLPHSRAVDLGQERELGPALRTNGAGLPGYLAGWFRLNNGEKALLFVTDRSRVFYCPTHDGYSVLLSVEDAEGVRAALAAAGAS
jgi:hypothetical protein